MISKTITVLVAAIIAAQNQCVEADESARYAQLADISAARAAEIVEVEEYEETYEPVEDWYVYEYQYYEPEPVYLGEGDSDGITADEFKFQGVVYDNGTQYTWYSQNVLPGGGLDELNANGRHVEGGYVMDADGYIAVASSDHEKGEILETPFGTAKVYDTGCASGVVDVYVGW